ncbi:hypothetical protein ZWY2020_029918 [Hordeum vulgare]|nr:hypothetical protein ZWY2020_029918 [Hordeum vulgare]
MDELDTDRDGYVDLGEFAAFHGHGRGERELDAELRDSFDVDDINGDGRISDTELSRGDVYPVEPYESLSMNQVLDAHWGVLDDEDVYGDEEWSFGYCENGNGVFSCPPGKNPMYTFRESIVLGKTSCSLLMVNQIARDLSKE